MKHQVVFIDPDNNEQVHTVDIKDETRNEDYPKYHAIIPIEASEWSEEPEEDVHNWITEQFGMPDQFTSEFVTKVN
jgi:hypothetical protein